jgi:hypothetical protein
MARGTPAVETVPDVRCHIHRIASEAQRPGIVEEGMPGRALAHAARAGAHAKR